MALRLRSVKTIVALGVIVAVGLLGTIVVVQSKKSEDQAGRTLTVCSDGCSHTTIASAIGAAAAGDTVIVSPGRYTGGITVDKAITLASKLHTGDKSAVSTTTLNGGAPTIAVRAPGARIIGFTFKQGRKGVVNTADDVEVLGNRFIDVGSDAVSWERTGGVISGNFFENPGDDCIDLDGPKSGVVADNTCLNPDDDGLETRLFDYSGPMQTIVIRDNTFASGNEDGIQLIDYPATSSYTYQIERNLLADNAMAGVGIMDRAETTEDYRSASIPERVHIINNTIVGNAYGLTGGDNSAVINNIFLNNKRAGIKGVNGRSAVSHNLFFGNPTAHIASNVDAATTRTGNPLVDAQYRLQAGSPAIDAGTAAFTFQDQLILRPQARPFAGAAPDLGRYESRPDEGSR